MKKVIAIVGTQWGDEGKGKVVDLLTPHFDIVARYQGGHNAGHTVIVGDHRFILRLLPSGILHPNKICVIGNGLVVDPVALETEIEELNAVGIEVKDRLWVSERAHLILPYHRALDMASEDSRGQDRVGTTLRGIGPAYEDKIGRRGLRAGELRNITEFRNKALANLSQINRQMAAQGYAIESSEAEYDNYFLSASRLVTFLKNTSYFLNTAVKEGKALLLEGAQGTMLDVDHGTFPFVTSSNSTAGGAVTGTGLAPTHFTDVLGITKAYTTRVGGGPFPTELVDSLGEHLRQRGNEFGAVTGRPRRTGWFDAVVVRYSVMINGLSTIALTKLDVLDDVAEIKICTAYRLEGKEVKEVPTNVSCLAKVEPVYHTLPGWQEDTSQIRNYQALPLRARNYVEFLADLIECPVGLVSTGPARDKVIFTPHSIIEQWFE